MTYLWIGVAGFFGAVARYAMSGVVSRVGETFPWGTFVVNVTGSFALGLLVSAFGHRLVVHADLRIALTVGFLGAYTTFSTFALETFEFLETGSPMQSVLNVCASIGAGLVAVWFGSIVGRSL